MDLFNLYCIIQVKNEIYVTHIVFCLRFYSTFKTIQQLKLKVVKLID